MIYKNHALIYKNHTLILSFLWALGKFFVQCGWFCLGVWGILQCCVGQMPLHFCHLLAAGKIGRFTGSRLLISLSCVKKH